MRVLNDGTAYAGDREAILASAREAAEISQNRLGSPQAALGALERAVALAPAGHGAALAIRRRAVGGGRAWARRARSWRG